MANIQHKDIIEANLHEPKGVSIAALGTSYVADGIGSGVWKKTGSANLAGLSGDGGISDKVVMSDGAGGFKLVSNIAYGEMGITNNTNNFATTASADPTLLTTTGYVLFTGGGAPWVTGLVEKTAFSTDKLTVNTTGVYSVNLWFNLSAFPISSSLLGVRFKINGSTWNSRPVILKANSSSDNGFISLTEMVSLTAGDYLQVFVGSSYTGNFLVKNANFTVDLKKAT